MRKLATIRKIDEVRPIPDADAIECAVVGGWTVVVKKGEFKVGDPAVYIEIDSWVPHKLAPFLSKGQEPQEFEGIKGERLRTIKLRGQVSQGLILPMDEIFTHDGRFFKSLGEPRGWFKYQDDHYEPWIPVDEGFDLTEILKVKKWEAPIPAQLSGQVSGSFPSFIPKTDQERIQNLVTELEEWKAKEYNWEITEKLDGTSMTVFLNSEGRFGVCGRNWELTETDENSLWRAARADEIENKIRGTGKALAIQGELIGEGIQGNPYKLKGQQFWVYDVFDIEKQAYWNAFDRNILITSWGLRHVPIEGTGLLEAGVDQLLVWAEGKSKLNSSTEREGLVYKCFDDPAVSFKTISNKFLLKNGG